jgi:YD repeat-containing protein
VTDYLYNDAGWLQDTLDPRGIDTRTLYDNLGRTSATIEAYTNGVPADESNRTTAYTYCQRALKSGSSALSVNPA